MSDIAALTARVEKLEHELAIQQDIHQIRRIQYTYGYFIDKSQYNEVVDLFAEDGEVWFLGGIYKGKAGVRRLYIERFQNNFTQGHNGPRYGWLLDHPQLQMVIDVAADRHTAQVRGRSMMQAGLHETAQGNPRAWWEGGLYENEFVRESDTWKIKALRYFPFWHGSFADGWQKTPIDFIPMSKTLFPQDPLGPDALIQPQPRCGPRPIRLPSTIHTRSQASRLSWTTAVRAKVSRTSDMSSAGVEVSSKINYLVPTSRINRRFWAPGREFNTGIYAPHEVIIRNARLAGPFTLDEHGFCLGHHPTDITDWEHNYGPNTPYADQVREVAKRLSGADVVATMGGMIRTSGSTDRSRQPPAAEAHVDFTQRSAERIANAIYRKSFPEGPAYRRFIAFSLWRALSPPPQDMPLALCEGSSVRDNEGTHNTKVDVEEIPTGDALFAPIEGEEDMAAATIFHHSPDHRWWYFPDMTPTEVIFIKFYDSDHSTAWRCPHTAFRDTSRPEARERWSMEFRGIAYFTGG